MWRKLSTLSFALRIKTLSTMIYGTTEHQRAQSSHGDRIAATGHGRSRLQSLGTLCTKKNERQVNAKYSCPRAIPLLPPKQPKCLFYHHATIRQHNRKRRNEAKTRHATLSSWSFPHILILFVISDTLQLTSPIVFFCFYCIKPNAWTRVYGLAIRRSAQDQQKAKMGGVKWIGDSACGPIGGR